MAKHSFVLPNMSLLLSSVVSSNPSVRAPRSGQLILQAKSALLVSLTQLGKQAVLYGSAALNLYMPRHHCLPSSDLDFYIVVSDPERFSNIVQRTCTEVNKQLRTYFKDASISVGWYLLSHGPDEITMSVSVNGIKFADLTRQFAHKLAPLERVFPRLCTKVVLPDRADEYDVWTISFQEAVHRIACTVACLPCLDGSSVISFHANSSRIAKDASRLAKLNDLSRLGLLSMVPSLFVLDAKELPQSPSTADVCVDPQTFIVMPSFMFPQPLTSVPLTFCSTVSETYVAPRCSARTLGLQVSKSVVDCCIEPDNSLKIKRMESILECRKRSTCLHNDMVSLRQFVQEETRKFAKHFQRNLADVLRATKQLERKMQVKWNKAVQSERSMQALYSASTKTIEEQKVTIRLCRDAIKDGLAGLVATTSAAVALKDLFSSLRTDCRVVVTKLSLVLKVITDGAPDDFNMQDLQDTFCKTLAMYAEKDVPGFGNKPSSPMLLHEGICSGPDTSDVFITLHMQLVRCMLQANDILIGKFDDSSTFTCATKCSDGVQFTRDAEIVEPRESMERRAELLTKHAESTLVFMMMPLFQRFSYIHRLARAATNDLVENSSLTIMLKMTKPGYADWTCLEEARHTVLRLKHLFKTLAKHV